MKLATFLLVAAVAAPASAAEESFATIREKAVAEASHGEGMRYANFARNYLLSRKEEAAKRCIAAGAEASARFEMLVWMAKDGSIERARVEPETPVSSCVATAVIGTRVGPPDKVPWVVHVEWEVAK